jgi:hypothetical protein
MSGFEAPIVVVMPRCHLDRAANVLRPQRRTICSIPCRTPASPVERGTGYLDRVHVASPRFFRFEIASFAFSRFRWLARLI